MTRWWTLDAGGVLVGFLAAALSLTPSLLPRPALLQGVVAGVAFGLGYLLGLLLSWMVARSIPWRPNARQRRIAWLVFLVALLAASVWLAVLALGWQNEVRRLVEMPEITGVDLTMFLIGAVPVAALGIAFGRGVRWLHRSLERLVGRGVAAIGTIVALWFLGAVLGSALLFAIEGVYEARNALPASWVSEPDSAHRSAGDGSAIDWAGLGRHGTAFVGGGPSAEEIEEATGEPAIEPIRVYASLQSADTAEGRAALAVEELERTGAFDRSVLVVATATGSGWLEPQTVDAVEYLHSGDTAIVATQYAFTPSWVSFVFDPDAPVDEASVLFDAVHAAWEARPVDERPLLVSYGLSLGAHGSQSAFSGVDDLRARTDGALFVGSPNGTPLWRSLTAARDAGSPEWRPVVDDGVNVRWASRPGDFAEPSGPWETPRVAYLQHATDPVTWLGTDLLWSSPDWLDAPRASDVSPSMRWIPVVTGLQVVIDMLMGESVPARHGHNYGDVVVEGWRSVTGDGGLDAAARARVQAIIEGYSAVQPVGSAS